MLRASSGHFQGHTVCTQVDTSNWICKIFPVFRDIRATIVQSITPITILGFLDSNLRLFKKEGSGGRKFWSLRKQISHVFRTNSRFEHEV